MSKLPKHTHEAERMGESTVIKYVVKRIVLLLPVLLGVSLVIFSIMEIAPGDPVRNLLGPDATEVQVEQLRHELGLDKGFAERYTTYVVNALTKGDFGNSWRTGAPVWDDIAPRLPVSLRLTTFNIIVATLLGIPLGVYSAVKQNSPGDNIMRVVSTIFVATPTFWFGMMLILLFSLYLGWLPPGGIFVWKGYILPVVCTSVVAACRIFRMTRSSMLECIREDYVRSARAKGVPEKVVVYRHALQNALLPVITTIGNTFGGVLGGSTIVESVFTLPGLGSLLVLSIKAKDQPTVIASVTFLAFFFALVMLLVDIIYAYVDPRIKAKYEKAE